VCQLLPYSHVDRLRADTVLAESHRSVLRGVTRPPLRVPVLAVEGSETRYRPPGPYKR
jgi:hypothetical protein